MYSDGASACTSTVAAFAKRGDLLVVDEGVCEALGTGVMLSRATVKYFKHNDMEDLRKVLERVEATDGSLGRKGRDRRKFIVVEGLYRNWGTVAPLDKIVALKHEFKYRLILDESMSFGAIGTTGRGAVEHFDLTPMVDVEIITISLENSLGSIGGVTVGNEEVVDHQRLSGAGYCFSASAPPFTASAAIVGLRRMRDRPDLLDRLRVNREKVYAELLPSRGKGSGGRKDEKCDNEGSVVEISKLLEVTSDPKSSIVFLQLSSAKKKRAKDDEGEGVGRERQMTREEQISVLDDVADRCLENGLAVVSTGGHVKEHLNAVPEPALRLTVSAAQSVEDIDRAIGVLREAVLHVIGEN